MRAYRDLWQSEMVSSDILYFSYNLFNRFFYITGCRRNITVMNMRRCVEIIIGIATLTIIYTVYLWTVWIFGFH